MTFRIRGRGDNGAWVLWPAAAIEKTRGEFMFGVYFLLWGVELECSW